MNYINFIFKIFVIMPWKHYFT